MSLKLLNGEQGYVIAPFSLDDCSSVVLLRPDVVRQCTCDEVMTIENLTYCYGEENLTATADEKEIYHADFCRFHRTFLTPEFQKLVLARSADVLHQGTSPASLFVRACKQYPDAFVTLFSAPQCGTWLMATPEVLLARDAGSWHTMALAGTMRYAEELPSWSEKNVHEQAYVAQYIKECLDNYSSDVKMEGPYTTRTGELVHLRSDFKFTLDNEAGVGDVLDSLHPTPAVCGLPKQQAQQFILENETCNRKYYSGFSGPLDLNGDTAMFVSLRCMRIFADRYRLYAGGGILPQSEESSEWDETAAKMQSMLSLIN